MRLNDAVIGGLLLALAVAVFLSARTLPDVPGQRYGAAVFPMLVACGLGGCGLALTLAGLRHWEGAVTPAPWMRSPAAWGRLSATLLLILFYIAAAEPLGFLPVAFVVLFALIVLLGGRWWVAALVAALVALVVAKSFGSLLLVPLPRGFLWL
ncbi:MAG: tripartite tricarboxylate transporter TctB family protein [Methylobacterium sp.]|uniref:tripartite tricarboxylate transporter TctB family protein n=1 Tax=Methylobacterium sp. TaxID=409 RepID=UPI00258FE22B|nr:tripartite tricarboxylate transporter TctB family protein [Methylobacterium sp.]MBY0294793.1 tripartite tricarboxylate transporter TctB family protein [Methylobacterium sp.]